jgi:hypothetical protein
MKAQIEEGFVIPPGFADICEINAEERTDTDSTGDVGESTIDALGGEVFFPKPSNNEQRRILSKMRGASSVLVQGPPGTGKSHTIANLICHLLATGQRILVTAKTHRALQVLMGKFDVDENEKEEKDEGLIPQEIRPLCISLLGSGIEEKKSLEASVGGILTQSENWEEKKAAKELKDREERLCLLREEEAKVDLRLRDIRQSETVPNSVAEDAYRGTAARIAEGVNRDRETLGWLADAISLEQPCAVSEVELQSIVVGLRRFTPEKRHELSLALPEIAPGSKEILHLIESEKTAAQEEALSATGADTNLADYLFKVGTDVVNPIYESLTAIQNQRRHLFSSSHRWMEDALRDISCGNPLMWRELHGQTKEILTTIESSAKAADETNLYLPGDSNIQLLLEDATGLLKYVKEGGTLGWRPFRPKLIREQIRALKFVRLNGRSCVTLEQLAVLMDVLTVKVGCQKAWGLWKGFCQEVQGSYCLQVSAIKSMDDALAEALSLETLIENCREAFRRCSALGVPGWTDETHILRLTSSCALAVARHIRTLTSVEIEKTERPLATLAEQTNAHPVCSEMLDAIQQRSCERFLAAQARVEQLKKERGDLQKCDESVAVLHKVLPNTTDALLATCNDPCWDSRARQIRDAWHWAQARFWVEQYISKEDAPLLTKRSRQMADEANATIAKLASLHAWSFCLSRLTESHRRHMEAWCRNVKALSKTGRGKRDFRNKQAAQKNLSSCKDAIPAWVMPLHRVWDTVDPAPGVFDVIIVDEASQCGLEALPLFYLGKKTIVVGDEKQISPSGEFQEAASISKLLAEHLSDFEFKDYFDVNVSLFAHAKLRCSSRRVRLREHFRCMPEIIRFSNDLCYSDQPLIPLKQYGPDRLEPLKRVFVEGGYREGDGNRVINRPEAKALVDKIAELCRDDRYTGKTMGVIVLQGEAQGGFIESMLLERLGASEMEERELLCGNPYTFQGAERDVIFLSMVAAPDTSGYFREGATDEQRYNVAASRAKEQMWLFHSVRSEDLSNSFLRKRLVGFFDKTRLSGIAGPIDWDNVEYRAAHDTRFGRDRLDPPAPFHQPGVVKGSWFEVDVALNLHRKGYRLIPQFPIAGYHID